MVSFQSESGLVPAFLVRPSGPEPRPAMAEHKKDFEVRIYPGAPHAFFNDSNPNTYQKEDAVDAWDRVLRFYRRTLLS